MMMDDRRLARTVMTLPPGTLITCEAGHEICNTLAPIAVDDVVYARHFGPVRAGQRPIVDGRPGGPCFCGAGFVRISFCRGTGAARGDLHTADGWMPKAPEPHNSGAEP